MTTDERERLENWARRRDTAQALAQRARLVLACAAGLSDSTIAREEHLSRPTVGRWRRRFLAQRIEGLLDELRPGAPRRIASADVEHVIRLTLDTTPEGATHWTTRSMAAASGLSQSAVSRIWRAFALQPPNSETFKLFRDPGFSEKVCDMVGLYMNPPDRALALSVDQTLPGHTLSRPAAFPAGRSGHLEWEVADRVHHRTTALFGSLELATEQIRGTSQPRERASGFRRYLDSLDLAFPADLQIHLILDDRATAKTPLIQRWLARHPRHHVHFTPTGVSWLSVVECWFAIMNAKQLRDGVFRSTQALVNAIRHHLDARTAISLPFVWIKS